jgi:hypothetical protein
MARKVNGYWDYAQLEDEIAQIEKEMFYEQMADFMDWQKYNKLKAAKNELTSKLNPERVRSATVDYVEGTYTLDSGGVANRIEELRSKVSNRYELGGVTTW